MSHLLPIGLDEEAFSDPSRRAEIESWLDVLADAADDLSAHGGGRDADFRNLSRSLGSDVEEIRYRYQIGRNDEARYFLIESTNNCVACHSRLPSARDFPLASRLIDQIDMEDMSVHEQAQIFVATRQFERALTTWEALFREKAVRPAKLDIGGYLLDYLAITLRVVQDPARAQRTLSSLSKRDDVPRYLARYLSAWTEDLTRFQTVPSSQPTLARAHELLGARAGSDGMRFSKERLVGDLLASGVLLRLIDTPKRKDAELAEAFYLLGVAELRSIEAFWVPQAEFHFEASIRMDPQGEVARDAYALLEESVLMGYTGSSGLHLPLDVRLKLEELGRLVDGETEVYQ